MGAWPEKRGEDRRKRTIVGQYEKENESKKRGGQAAEGGRLRSQVWWKFPVKERYYENTYKAALRDYHHDFTYIHDC